MELIFIGLHTPTYLPVQEDMLEINLCVIKFTIRGSKTHVELEKLKET